MSIPKIFCAVLIAFIIICSACKSSQINIDVPERSLEEVLNGLSSNKVEYQFFSSKAKIKLNGNEVKLGGRSHIRMIKDSLIWMNFKKLNIEGARALITPDSTWILYRQDNLYEVGGTEELLYNLDIFRPFGEIQDILLGNLPTPSRTDIKDFSISNFYKLSFEINGDYYQYLIKQDYSIFRALIKDRFGRTILATFSEYDDQKFSTKKEFNIDSPEAGETTFVIKLSSIEFDVPKKNHF